MKNPLLAALALGLAASAAFARDGGLARPPAAHGHQVQAECAGQAHGLQCPQGTHVLCQDGQWTCGGLEHACEGQPSGDCGQGTHSACVDGHWTCEKNDNGGKGCSGPKPFCRLLGGFGLGSRKAAVAACVDGRWRCPGKGAPGDGDRLGHGSSAPPAFSIGGRKSEDGDPPSDSPGSPKHDSGGSGAGPLGRH